MHAYEDTPTITRLYFGHACKFENIPHVRTAGVFDVTPLFLPELLLLFTLEFLLF